MLWLSRFLTVIACSVLLILGLSGCDFSSPVPAEAPNITSVYPTELTAGEQFSFSAGELGQPQPTMSWDFGGGAVPNSSGERAPLVRATTPGVYNCSVSASNSSGQSSFDFMLTVTPPPVPELLDVLVLPAASGGDVFFNVGFANYADFPPRSTLVDSWTWSWDLGGGATPLTGFGLNRATVPATALAPGTYEGSVTVSNFSGSDTDEFSYTVTQ